MSQTELLQEFSYSEVRLTGGPLKRQFDRLHADYLALDNDRLLKVYRQRAGQPAPGRDMGGWYDADGFVPGHSLGQYISGLARMGSIARDSECHNKVRELVEGYADTLGASDYPYASSVASTTWPCYILDKLEIGLIDSYQLSGVEQSRELLSRVIHGALPYLPNHGYDRGPNSPKRAPYDETYVLPENLFFSWRITGDRKFLEMARLYLLDKEFFDPLARGQNILPGKHAYSHALALSSGAQAYLVDGDAKHKAALQNAWQMIESTQRYASGGWGPKETFVEAHQGKLYESLLSTKAHFETPCGSYAAMKMNRYLLRFTGDARYGDALERVYNTTLSAKDPDSDGDYAYYSNYGPEADKDVRGDVAARDIGSKAGPGDRLPGRRRNETMGANRETPGVRNLLTHSGMAAKLSKDLREWAAIRHCSPAGKLRRVAEGMDGQRLRRSEVCTGVSRRIDRRSSPKYRRVDARPGNVCGA